VLPGLNVIKNYGRNLQMLVICQSVWVRVGFLFAAQKLILSSSFRCDKIYKCDSNESHFVMLLMFDIDVQQTGLRPQKTGTG
jgi:hypothetical protein